jgi:hypothetical protein
MPQASKYAENAELQETETDSGFQDPSFSVSSAYSVGRLLFDRSYASQTPGRDLWENFHADDRGFPQMTADLKENSTQMGANGTQMTANPEN